MQEWQCSKRGLRFATRNWVCFFKLGRPRAYVLRIARANMGPGLRGQIWVPGLRIQNSSPWGSALRCEGLRT